MLQKILVVAVLVLCISAPSVNALSALHPDFLGTIVGSITIPGITTGNVNFSDPTQLAKFLLDLLPGKSLEVSYPCYNDTMTWFLDLMQGKMYAIEMLDAFAKIPAGISKGHILWMGAYDMCVAARRNVTYITKEGKESFDLVPAAKYCVVRLNSTLLSQLPSLLAFATCLPASCSAKDADELLISLIHILNLASGVTAGKGTACSDEKIPAQGGTTTTLIIIGIIVLACIWCTIIHFFFRLFDKRWWNIEEMNEAAKVTYVSKKRKIEDELDNKGFVREEQPDIDIALENETSFDQTNPAPQDSAKIKTEEKKTWKNKYPIYMKLVLCFSIVHNVNKIFAPAAPGQLKYLDGMRVISMWWVMLGHIYHLGQSFFNNQYEIVDSLKGVLQQIPLNASFGIDTFFFLSGLLIAYTLLKEVERTKSCLPLAFSYPKRIWRLTPLYMVVLLVYLYIVPYVVGGPYSLIVKQEGSPTEFCKKYWWTNLLYINNIIPLNKNEMCMSWTWFLSADMQLFIITPIILAIVVKLPKLGTAIMAALIVACVATISSLVSLYGLPLTALQLHDPLPSAYKYDETFEYFYDKPYAGGIAFFMGAMMAVYMVRFRGKNAGWYLPVFICGWVLSIIAGVCCVMGLYMGGLETKTDMTLGERTAYAALTRLAWSLSIAWVVYACQYDYGMVVRSFLSLRIWTVLGRLTYAAFLVHFLILQMYYTSLRTMLGYTWYQVVTIFWSQVVSVYLVAFIAALFVEMPLRNIEKLFWFRRV
ncbi:nose resistant to fluoxetine protein 6-like [Paramacrobiotus metropolitanus]|uniref:nose resistant to fluoxetine protein 6-like n=1 Tax=Paramacrobiotus metropolitanus TaxID=2943436 RepID=UPI0024463FCC|nr:nose resistant to fluoxetine protein 6-like [Paramacrobiotus metropolitanus]